jgi:hypothetical protein
MSDCGNGIDRVTLPVKLINGRWELLYGGGIAVREGALGELTVAVSSIDDQVFLERLTNVVTVKVLDQGSELRVALRDRGGAQPAADRPDVHHGDLPPGCNRFERIVIASTSPATKVLSRTEGGLWIRQRGVDRTQLVCSSVAMPEGMTPTTAISLNHACTLLSEKYETHRLSHTLNVYQHVFFQDAADSTPRWRPLEHLRQGIIRGMERGIVAAAWAQLEAQLGFRPLGHRG